MPLKTKLALETIIGLETHVQLKTHSKMFCACDNDSEHATPNTNICPICLAHPGTLPVVNIEALRFAIKTALALHCQINLISKFDRKNYFYPDLPKNYQISQYDLPIGYNGLLEFFSRGTLTQIRIERLHLEEDAAKLIHPQGKNYSLIDFNRAGTPLMEIVTHPDFRSPQDAKAYLQTLRLIMRYLDISHADMEKGHLRCDANISLRPKGDEKLYTKTEIKNLNSFKAVERALEYEIKRQSNLWQEGNPPHILTTRGWNEKTQKTYEQRTKEKEQDYRYFPEPDLPPLHFTDSKHLHGHLCKDKPIDEINIDCLKSTLSELPAAKIKRFIEEYKFSFADAKQLSENQSLANFSEQVMSELLEVIQTETDIETTQDNDEFTKKLGKLVGGWHTSELVKLLYAKEKKVKEIAMTPHSFAELLTLILEKKITSSVAKQILEKMIESEQGPKDILEEESLAQMEDEEELGDIIINIIESNQKVVEQYKKGKIESLKFLLGQVMRETQGRANPQLTSTILKRLLK